VTDYGIEVPIIDVTHPTFRVELSEQELAAAVAKAVADVESRAAPLRAGFSIWHRRAGHRQPARISRGNSPLSHDVLLANV
jgi:hypothetical protein